MTAKTRLHIQVLGPAFRSPLFTIVAPLLILLLGSCGGSPRIPDSGDPAADADDYIVGPGDSLEIFVWGHDDLSTTVQVRPDGEISTPLVEDMQAAGKTPTELGRDIEAILMEFVRSPTVTVIVQEFVGEYDRQIRVVGQATEPQALSYREGMTVLDVMIEVGGLAEFASGNRAKIVRRNGDEETKIRVRLNDLLYKGDMRQNVRMLPGDILIIPESFF